MKPKHLYLLAWLLMLLAQAIAGCGGKSTASFVGTQSVTVKPDGTVRVEKTGESRGKVETPADAAAPSPLNATVDGITSATSGTHVPPAIDPLTSQLSVYHLAAIGSGVVGLAVSLIFGWRWGLPVMGLGAAFGLAPTVIERAGPVVGLLAGIGVVLAVVGVVAVYVTARVRERSQSQAAAAAGAAKLTREQSYAEAMAALRAAFPQVDAAFQSSVSSRARP